MSVKHGYTNYAGRVRRLVVTAKGLSIADDIGFGVRQQLSTPILPNLLSIKWTCTVDLCLARLLFHPSIEALTIYLVKENTASCLIELCDLIRQNTPNLISLEVRGSTLCASRLQDSLSGLVAGLPLLKNFTSTVGPTSPRLFEALAVLPCVRLIDIDIAPMSYCLRLGSSCMQMFPSLRDLKLTIPLDRFTTLLSTVPKLQSLDTLSLTSPCGSPSPDECTVFAFAKRLADACGSLSSLHLMLIDIDDISSLEDLHPQASRQIAFGQIAPFLTISGLISLIVEHAWSIILTSDDIVQCLHAWPRMETLVLNPAPPFLGQPLLLASSLSGLSAPGSRLKRLGLHLDFACDSRRLVPSTLFSSVETLHVGLSYADDPEHAAHIMRTLWPGLLQLHWRTKWSLVLIGCDCPSPSIGVVKEVTRRQRLWSDVDKLLRPSHEQNSG
jgi:hypothetical protein